MFDLNRCDRTNEDPQHPVPGMLVQGAGFGAVVRHVVAVRTPDPLDQESPGIQIEWRRLHGKGPVHGLASMAQWRQWAKGGTVIRQVPDGQPTKSDQRFEALLAVTKAKRQVLEVAEALVDVPGPSGMAALATAVAALRAAKATEDATL